MSNSMNSIELQKRMSNPVREGYREFDNEGDTHSVAQTPLPRPVEDTSLFHERAASQNTITSEQAFVHMKNCYRRISAVVKLIGVGRQSGGFSMVWFCGLRSPAISVQSGRPKTPPPPID
ncbi:hypothetical protein TELCIR_12926 [Teladorsagia circumcincta]|uniref:Uncharacterized protein n=1 Tax=Teladorsagia circumcincta TaxID=45464 RepID=A0A2G9U7D4_TELCI|nr:hypothetical protein TELCIR_12926 [Teladorsagia circumcincta]